MQQVALFINRYIKNRYTQRLCSVSTQTAQPLTPFHNKYVRIKKLVRSSQYTVWRAK